MTRKNDVYAFATSTSRAKKSVLVCACQMPIAAKSAPCTTRVTSSARGSHAAIGVRARTPKPAVKGKTKNASAIAPARSSHVQRYDDREERDEGGEGQGQEERQRLRTLAAQHPVREREHDRGDDEVQRQQQERLLVAELDRDPERRGGEERDGNRSRVADERDRQRDRGEDAGGDEREAERLGEEQLEVVVPDERPAEAGGPETQQGESEQRQRAPAREHHEDGAERSEQCCDLGGGGVLQGEGTLRQLPSVHRLL